MTFILPVRLLSTLNAVLFGYMVIRLLLTEPTIVPLISCPKKGFPSNLLIYTDESFHIHVLLSTLKYIL